MDLFENLSDNQIEAVKTIDEDLEIIACAGAGKTGVVTRRIINILKSNPDILPENIVAFTFINMVKQCWEIRRALPICILVQYMVSA